MKINPPQLSSGTVSETVSEKCKIAVKNCGGLARITIEFTSKMPIFPLLNRALQVAARLDPPTTPTTLSPRVGN